MAKAKVDESGYVAALLSDLRSDLASFADAVSGRKLHSIFIGGGTPSLFSTDSVAAILGGVAQQIAFSENIEITLEANPGSAEANKFRGFREAGVNRLSIGVQSFNAAHLKALGRIHNNEEASSAAGYAIEAGFDNFNLDLMFGLPGQSTQQALDDVAQAIALRPTHLSCYQLTIEPNTLFHHQPPITPDDEALWEMQQEIQSALAVAGYQQYEISAYSQEHRQCRHNLNYWRYGDYLGIGAGAHGKISGLDGQVRRNWKIKHPASYLQKSASGGDLNGAVTAVTGSDLSFEFMMNALRLSDGFELELFSSRSGQSVHSIKTQLDQHQQLGLITITDQHLQLTARGKAMLNSLLQDYLPDAE